MGVSIPKTPKYWSVENSHRLYENPLREKIRARYSAPDNRNVGLIFCCHKLLKNSVLSQPMSSVASFNNTRTFRASLACFTRFFFYINRNREHTSRSLVVPFLCVKLLEGYSL